MSESIEEIIRFMDHWAPFSSAEDGDNVGHLVSAPKKQIFKTLVALDVSADVVRQAIQQGADLIISHHPVIFHPLRKIEPRHQLLRMLIKNDIQVISIHTNMDKAQGGVNDALAAALQLRDVTSYTGNMEMGRMGNLPFKMNTQVFADFVKRNLNAQMIAYTNIETEINKVAVLGGGGDFAWEAARDAGADAFVTGDVRHHVFIDSCNSSFCVIAAGHFETEQVVCDVIVNRLRERFDKMEIMRARESSPCLSI